MDSSNRSEPMEITSRESTTGKRRLPTAGSSQQNKNKILKGRRNPSKETTKSSSTSKEKGSYGWWTKSCEEISKKLWYPIEIGSVDSVDPVDPVDLTDPSTSSNGYVLGAEQNSWSKTKRYIPRNRNFPRISWPSSMFSHADTMECEDMQGKEGERNDEDEMPENTTLPDCEANQDASEMDEGGSGYIQHLTPPCKGRKKRRKGKQAISPK